ncbi:biotin--[acetyl-CoA-carboxylase] ligase [Marinobacter xestospongiae]|uniref:biotin--[acetyl-CoA-carboxylase] ligase n=1 Tax=Marinobacter xestospongiae TaxID=994319 RepID=UPI0020059BD1|nr:biotin--[acetyl-CoA-carboxylase] ligase [Marinobacter xestospongiae]MCK7568426.1 biotin--[acetyl-CoA-carboxylase] ligase [Marinobacter xestospongiae]
MNLKVLVELLSDGQVHSGESLAQRLGISRTAIWKQLRKAQEQGVEIETIRGKGYRLQSPVDLLDHDRICAGLGDGLAQQLRLMVLDEVDSTNAEIMRQRRLPGQATGTLVCLADCQTAGRGRRGRAWQSPKGENLYISFGLGIRGGFSELDGLSLVFGVALAEAIESFGTGPVQLKWPNDVYHNGSKLGGILIELLGELEEGFIQVVIGIGVNVHMHEASDVDQAWTSLARVAPEQEWNRNALAAELVTRVLAASEAFQTEGFGRFHERWSDRDLFRGRSLVTTQGQLVGTGCGIDQDGSYLVEDDAGNRSPVRAGEISLRIDA